MNSENNFISVFGARVHNLKSINIKIPRNKLVVFTGKSGSGKSSLAFDTIHAEGQRRYLDTFNAYARQFIGNMDRPEVDKITGLSPVVAIDQKTTSKNPRSTVGTITEIYDYLRLLYSRVGVAYSYKTGEKMVRYSENMILSLVLKDFLNNKISILSPVIRSRKGNYRELFNKLLKRGYSKVRVNGEILNLDSSIELDRYQTHNIELVVDRLSVNEKNKVRLKESLQIAMEQGGGVVMIYENKDKKIRFLSKFLMCPTTGIAYDNPEPNSFSFNSPKGACKSCNGLGFKLEVDVNKIIPDTKISIKNGAIAPINGRNAQWIIRQIELIGKKYDFTIDTPVEDICIDGLNAILYGINTKVKINYKVAEIAKDYNINFDGIITFINDQSKYSNSKSIDRWVKKYMRSTKCEECKGSRLNLESSNFKVAKKYISEVVNMHLYSFSKWLQNLQFKLTKKEMIIAHQIIKELLKRVQFLNDVGLSYLTLNRSTKTLSGGEAQRIRLATQIGTRLTNVLYILDEPSIGLHQKDNLQLINALKSLRDLGNSVIVVEHDKEMIKNADYIVDLGPDAGENGGELIFQGSFQDLIKVTNITSDYVTGLTNIKKSKFRSGNGNFIEIIGARGNNLKNINIKIPLGLLCCITGVSGSGKSTIVNETLFPILNKHFFRAEKVPLEYDKFNGIENIDKVISINQAPIGRTPRSNPATYIGVFSDIRNLFADLQASKIRGYKAGRFSFNVSGGRCEVCKGAGVKTIEMNFLPDVVVNCDECNGKRYNNETLQVYFKEKNISDVLNLTVNQAVVFFEKIPVVYRKLKALDDVGLGYIRLGQSAITFSGGEAQRIKLATELSKKETGNTLYILDEPSTGLHFADIQVLLKVLNFIVDKGNTVLVIEHNLDIIKVADYIIDVGPEGGENGGDIVCQGTLNEILNNGKGHTAKFLIEELNN